MTEVTLFQSTDGSIWDTEAKAYQRDKEISAIEKAFSFLLDAEIDGNGENYLQQTSDGVSKFIIAVGDGLEDCGKAEMARLWRAQPRGIVGRYFDDSRDPFYKCWCRLNNIDSEFREWGQAYFALHPNPEAIEVPA